MNHLQNAIVVVKTRDHWTSLSNQNYLRAHTTHTDWNVHLFASTVKQTKEGQFAKSHPTFFWSSEQWDVWWEVTTIGTDSGRNMTAAERLMASGSISFSCLDQICSLSVSSCEPLDTMLELCLLFATSKQLALLHWYKILVYSTPRTNDIPCSSGSHQDSARIVNVVEHKWGGTEAAIRNLNRSTREFFMFVWCLSLMLPVMPF